MSTFNYINAEFRGLGGGDCRLKITSTNGDTKWLSVSDESVEEIRALLAAKEEEGNR